MSEHRELPGEMQAQVCVLSRSKIASLTWACANPSIAKPPPTATSAATISSSPGNASIKQKR